MSKPLHFVIYEPSETAILPVGVRSAIAVQGHARLSDEVLDILKATIRAQEILNGLEDDPAMIVAAYDALREIAAILHAETNDLLEKFRAKHLHLRNEQARSEQ